LRETGYRLAAPLGHSYPAAAPTSIDPSTGLGGGTPTLGSVRGDVLGDGKASVAILNCYCGLEALRNPDLAAALATAINDWQLAEWLERDDRLRASIVVGPHDPHQAAAEIERLAGNGGFVQVLLPVRSQIPYGNRCYAPIFEKAEERGLVVGIRFGGTPGTPPTQSGWPTYYLEEYVGMAQVCQSQVISLISEGVFDRWPRLRVALIGCGFTWIPSLMWRLDKDWKGLRREIPWVRYPPSTYIRDHMRATLQPVDPPEEPALLFEVVEQIASPEFLMFATDYPHRHPSDAAAFLSRLTDEARAAVLGGNATRFYRLG
jgi:predicted TIM-barrel fold metal-dependent hydrolase